MAHPFAFGIKIKNQSWTRRRFWLPKVSWKSFWRYFIQLILWKFFLKCIFKKIVNLSITFLFLKLKKWLADLDGIISFVFLAKFANDWWTIPILWITRYGFFCYCRDIWWNTIRTFLKRLCYWLGLIFEINYFIANLLLCFQKPIYLKY